MKNTLLKNLLAENMKRFGTKNLSESDLKRINEQEQLSADAIEQAVNGMNKQIEAAAAKNGVTIVNHLKMTLQSPGHPKMERMGLYLVDDYNFKNPSVSMGGGRNYLGAGYSLTRPMTTAKVVQGKWYGQLVKLRKAGNSKHIQFSRDVWKVLSKTPVAGQPNIFHAIWALSGGGQEQG